MNSDLYNTTAMFAQSNAVEFQIDEEVLKLCLTLGLMTWFIIYALDCCSDPFGEKLRSRMKELETDLDNAETTICGYEEEIEALTNKLKEMNQKYDICRNAAREFIDTFPESTEEPKMKRSRID